MLGLQEHLSRFNYEITNFRLLILFPTYKIHKHKFRWISDASSCLFFELTKDITQCLNLVLHEFQLICAEK